MNAGPRFPTYHAPPIPEVLNPLDPRHYAMLLKWIYFQPSRLKHYLYRVDPDLYRSQGLRALAHSLRLPGYRNLYSISLIMMCLLSLGLAWVASVLPGEPVDWRGVVLGLAAGLFFGAVTVVFGSMAYGVCSGPVLGVPFGVVFGFSFSIVFVVASGVAFLLTGGAAFSVAGSVAFAIALGITVVMTVGVSFGMTHAVALTLLLIIALGVTFGVALVVSGGAAVSVAFVVSIVVVGIAGGSRLLFYPFEWVQAHLLARSQRDPFLALERHPTVWDELTLWPLPETAKLLQTCLDQDLTRGLRLALRIAMSCFQRCAVQRGLTDFLTARSDLLAMVYLLVRLPMLDEYLVPPARRLQFRGYKPARLVLLGELGQQCVIASSETTGNTEYLVWRFTNRWRRMDPTPLSQFCFLLYELLWKEPELKTTDTHEIKLAERFETAYQGVRPYKHGDEIADSFATMAAFLDARDVDALAHAHEHLTWADDLAETPLRPSVVEALKALGDISQEVAAFARATNTSQKSAGLNRAAGGLNELAGYVRAEVQAPECVLLDRVVVLWKSIVASEQGRLGEAALQEMAPAARRAAGFVERRSKAWQRPAMPFDNPYIVGDPVYPPLLVGRKDVFDRIGEVWAAKENPDSIIVYGHRRMGKSSILRNLDQVAPPGSVVVYADMAGETSFVATTADLLLGLADRVYVAVRRVYPGTSGLEPDPVRFDTQARAQFQFNRLLDRVREILAGRIMVLALDEFEGVERAVESNKVGREIYQFLRSKTQEPWLALVFGGLHTLDEMSRDYQQPFYGSYENIPVSYLPHDAAWRLITNPTEDFALNYEHEAIERVITVTGGQPYLVQQICRDALDHLNHELFDLDLDRPVCITLADVDSVLGDDFFRRGTVYFDGVWTQAKNREQRVLLRVMAGQDEPWASADLESATGLDERTLRHQLRWAERHDIIRQTETDTWGFHVPLMRRWIRQRG